MATHARARQLLQAVLSAAVVLAGACAPLARPFHGPYGAPHADAASLAEARRLDRIEALIEEGAVEEAGRALDEAVTDGLEHPRVFLLRGRLHLARPRPAAAAEAVPWLERAVAAAPSWIDPRLDLAQAFLRLERLAAAEEVYHELDRLFPEHPAGPYGRGWLALLRGHDERARALIAESLERDADYAPALYARSRLAARDGDEALQRAMLQRYLARRPLDARALAELGDLHLAAGRPEDARRAWERSHELRPDPSVARRLADLARARGDDRGVEAWEGVR